VTNRTRSLGASVHAARDHHEAAVDHRIIVVVVDDLTSLQQRGRFLVCSKGNVWVHHAWSSSIRRRGGGTTMYSRMIVINIIIIMFQISLVACRSAKNVENDDTIGAS
jgi:hypothetical protein